MKELVLLGFNDCTTDILRLSTLASVLNSSLPFIPAIIDEPGNITDVLSTVSGRTGSPANNGVKNNHHTGGRRSHTQIIACSNKRWIDDTHLPYIHREADFKLFRGFITCINSSTVGIVLDWFWLAANYYVTRYGKDWISHKLPQAFTLYPNLQYCILPNDAYSTNMTDMLNDTKAVQYLQNLGIRIKKLTLAEAQIIHPLVIVTEMLDKVYQRYGQEELTNKSVDAGEEEQPEWNHYSYINFASMFKYVDKEYPFVLFQRVERGAKNNNNKGTQTPRLPTLTTTVSTNIYNSHQERYRPEPDWLNYHAELALNYRLPDQSRQNNRTTLASKDTRSSVSSSSSSSNISTRVTSDNEDSIAVTPVRKKSRSVLSVHLLLSSPSSSVSEEGSTTDTTTILLPSTTTSLSTFTNSEPRTYRKRKVESLLEKKSISTVTLLSSTSVVQQAFTEEPNLFPTE
jgi:hypothetical protein